MHSICTCIYFYVYLCENDNIIYVYMPNFILSFKSLNTFPISIQLIHNATKSFN